MTRGGKREHDGAGGGTTPRLTVALVVLDAAGLLEETIESVFGQSFPDREIVVVDGGSTDGTLDIIRRHADRIDLFVSEPDRGIYDAMNKAGDLARGEYLNFMNAGDSFASPDAVANVFAAFDGSPDLVYGNAFAVKDGERTAMRSGGDPGEVLYDRIPFCHQALFTRTETFRRYRFREEFRIAADYDFALRCYLGGAVFRHVAVPVANYRIGGFTKQNADRGALEVLKSMYDNGLDPERIRKSAVFRALVRRMEPDEMRDLKIREQAETLTACRERIARLEEEVEKLKKGRAGGSILGGIRSRIGGGSGEPSS